MGIEDLAAQGIKAHAVDGEVPAPRGFGKVELGIGLDQESAMARRHLAVAAGEGEIHVDAFDPEHPEGAPHRNHPAELRQHRLQFGGRQAVDLHVQILGLDAEQVVAHVAADHQGPAAGFGDALGDVAYGFVFHGVKTILTGLNILAAWGALQGRPRKAPGRVGRCRRCTF